MGLAEPVAADFWTSGLGQLLRRLFCERSYLGISEVKMEKIIIRMPIAKISTLNTKLHIIARWKYPCAAGGLSRFQR